MSIRRFFGSLRRSDKRRSDKREKDQKDQEQRAQSDAHEKVLESLDVIYRLVEEDTRVYLDTMFTNALNIKCEDLVLNGDGSYSAPAYPCFFQPCPLDRLGAHPIDPEHSPTQAEIRSNDACWEGVPILKESYLDEADFMCSIMDWNFRAYKRKAEDNRQIKLMSLTNWRPVQFSNSVIHDAFEETVFNSMKWTPINAWQPPKGQPHVMFTMAHGYLGDEKLLLRGEVLAIVAAMITRLERRSLQSHNIIPVMVFSFMGGKQGRILQAYFNSQGLVIRKTQLYDFSTSEKAKLSTELFLQYMTSDMIGDTQQSSTS
ncbi:hypothetical protein VTN77DRAFT_1955 [Rasamsonia byssochlamydoides]|uniref:uncharacterized protein n=1 Tax=Rasamsonia byssochlamydoides TaxID=89139 RepID=UPI003743794A